ncbi:MAG TPA: ATP-binding protein [Steroidobacteraceae bacterium]|nr:ATP-binding protein [Steroidobacteraceae bacterium]
MPQSASAIRRRVMGMMLITSAAAILLTCSGFVIYEFTATRQQVLEQISTLARIIATNSTAALAFHDVDDAQEVLAALRNEPSVSTAALYDEHGAVFARYPSTESLQHFPRVLGSDGYSYENGAWSWLGPVNERSDARLGTLYIRWDMHRFYQRYWLYGLIAAVVMSASMLLAYLLSRMLHQRISRPITSLVQAAHAVSERNDYSVRVEPVGAAEFQHLTTTFNEMLGRIEEQSSALRDKEQRLWAQLSRLNLLHRTTRAIGERQDLHSIYQVILHNLEDDLPVDFACIAVRDSTEATLRVAGVGSRSAEPAAVMQLHPNASVFIEQNGLSKCLQGVLVYEPDIRGTDYEILQRFEKAGLASVIAAPMSVENRVFGVLICARALPQAFSSGDCEFLRQLSEHVALAANQVQLYTELQQAFDELRVSQQTLMQQERLRALGQMASGVAHDINNAISPISLYTESLLEREPGLSERAREYLRTIQRAIADVGQTVARMREFYRTRDQQTQLVAVDLNALVDQALTLTRARWSDMPQERGIVIEIERQLTATLPKIKGIESDIRDALTNLIFNAVDAMPDGGRLTLRTRADATADTGEWIVLEIQDSGVGMDEETRRRCLEPFFTTKGERGTGMGLAMVYGMAKRQGAQLEIDSAVGSGTTIRIKFARAEETGAETYVAGSNLRARSLKLLVIDDDPLLREALFSILQSEGHTVTLADGGQAGIDAFVASMGDVPFDAVFTDLGMPYVDGRAVAKAIKANDPHASVIMLTGWGQRLNTEQTVPPNVDVVLSKPPSLQDLRRTLAQVSALRPKRA